MPKARMPQASIDAAKPSAPNRKQSVPTDGMDSARLVQDLLFFGMRELNLAADAVLTETGWGRAHHRALHFIASRPGLAVADLLTILSITKQSLGRVMIDLLNHGLLEQKTSKMDRRRRLLYLTEAGRRLERRLHKSQQETLARAFTQAGPKSVEGFRQVLIALMGADGHAYVFG